MDIQSPPHEHCVFIVSFIQHHIAAGADWFHSLPPEDIQQVEVYGVNPDAPNPYTIPNAVALRVLAQDSLLPNKHSP